MKGAPMNIRDRVKLSLYSERLMKPAVVKCRQRLKAPKGRPPAKQTHSPSANRLNRPKKMHRHYGHK